MRIIVRIVRGWRRIGMDVRRLLIWGVRGRICFMRGENLGKLVDGRMGVSKNAMKGYPVSYVELFLFVGMHELKN